MTIPVPEYMTRRTNIEAAALLVAMDKAGKSLAQAQLRFDPANVESVMRLRTIMAPPLESMMLREAWGSGWSS